MNWKNKVVNNLNYSLADLAKLKIHFIGIGPYAAANAHLQQQSELGLVLLLAAVIAVPVFRRLGLGAILGYLAWKMWKRTQEGPEAATGDVAALPAPGAPDRNAELTWDELRPVDPLGLEVGYRLIPLVDKNQGGELMSRIKAVRRKLTQDLGFLIPPVHIRDNLELPSNGYRLLVHGVPVASAEIHPDRELALDPGGAFAPIDGIAGKDPATDKVPDDPASQAHFAFQNMATLVANGGGTLADARRGRRKLLALGSVVLALKFDVERFAGAGEVLERGHQLGAVGTVDGAVVEAAGGRHDCGDGEGVIDDIGPLLACADRHDHRLWRVDDGFELLDAHHAHVGDGRGAALIFMGLQLAVLRAARKLGNFGRDFRQRLVCSVRHDGRNQPSGHRYRNADVGAAVLQHIVTGEAHIAFRHLNQRKAKRLDQHVIDRKLYTAWFQRGVKLAA